jgi:hypothetical protein
MRATESSSPTEAVMKLATMRPLEPEEEAAFRSGRRKVARSPREPGTVTPKKPKRSLTWTQVGFERIGSPLTDGSGGALAKALATKDAAGAAL